MVSVYASFPNTNTAFIVFSVAADYLILIVSGKAAAPSGSRRETCPKTNLNNDPNSSKLLSNNCCERKERKKINGLKCAS